jgi:hypothetical protein
MGLEREQRQIKGDMSRKGKNGRQSKIKIEGELGKKGKRKAERRKRK